MLRLRITAALSLLGLAIGVVGTAWLSTLGEGWLGPAPTFAQVTPHRSLHRPVPAPAAPWHGPISVVPRHRAGPMAAPPVRPSAPELVPLSTSADNSLPWYKLRGHLDGRVRVHLSVDGNGHIRAAHLASSSGDTVLDAHALRSVQGWSFAVPADHLDGFSGDLPMRFSSQPPALARVP